MKYTLSIEPEAEADIEATFRWYEERSKGLGSEFLRAVDAIFASIRRHPLAFPIVYKQMRRALLRRFPYGIFYIVEDSSKIAVLGCFHAKRHPKSWQRRA